MLNNKGITKTIEECSELITVLAKQLAMPSLDEHEYWDNKGNLLIRIQEEVADVEAACYFLTNKFNLDVAFINTRIARKIELFEYWDKGGTETKIPEKKEFEEIKKQYVSEGFANASDLDKTDWAIVTATEVIDKDLTYWQALEITKMLQLHKPESFGHEATIVTNDTADKFSKQLLSRISSGTLIE